MRTHGVGAIWFAAAVLGLTATGCHHAQGGEALAPYQAPPTQSAADPNDQGAASDQAEAEPEAPPAAVDEDPAAPLHEAVVGSPAAYEAFAVNDPPPDAVVEDRPSAPDPAMQWIPGYWWYSQRLSQYIWITGAWRNAPPSTSWVPGSWNVSDGRYAWSPGYWAPAGYRPDGAAFLNEPPPAPQVERIVESSRPGPDYAWVPGAYEIREGRYFWVGGRWGRAPIAGSAWVEPRYVRVGARYVYTPGRWDYAVERRGAVYRPVVGVRAGVRVAPVAVRAEVVSRHASYTEHVAARTRAHVEVRGSAHVAAHVEAHGSAHAEAHGSTHAEAHGSGHAETHEAAHPNQGGGHADAHPEHTAAHPTEKGASHSDSHAQGHEAHHETPHQEPQHHEAAHAQHPEVAQHPQATQRQSPAQHAEPAPKTQPASKVQHPTGQPAKNAAEPAKKTEPENKKEPEKKKK